MEEPICLACGTQFSAEAPQACPICEDERQFVPSVGQGWTTLSKMQKTHMGAFRHDGECLGIGISPAFAIGQRALLVRTPAGNVLWDCVSLISPAMVELIRGLGGVDCIALRFPIRIFIARCWRGAGPLAGFRSICMQPTGAG